MSSAAADLLRDARVLVTGCCGTVGSELVRQLLDATAFQPREVVGVDHRETELFFEDQRHLRDPRATFLLADLRDAEAIAAAMEGVDVVFHTAALKHVVLCERSPFEAVQTNIVGLQNVLLAARRTRPKVVLFTSSDKAVNPTNVMGTSKLMGERLMTAANASTKPGGTVYASTRFGNVLGSSGSVIPVFKRQIAAGGPVTVTDSRMTRFVMSISESVGMVLESAALARGGEVFITKMPVVAIPDLARAMIDRMAEQRGLDPASIRIETIGMKPGEKLYEELLSDEETRRSVELDRYYVVLPAFRGLYDDIEYEYPGLVSREVEAAYTSAVQPPMDVPAIASMLRRDGLLDDREEDPPAITTLRRYWPGDKEAAARESSDSRR